jgi:hypothetical protein
MTVNVKKAVSHGRFTSKTKTDGLETAVLDKAAILLQRLRNQGRLAHDQPLVRLDYRSQVHDAPFRFDSARGVLHRKDCSAIPADSRSALYGVWRIEADDRGHACKKCKPTPDHNRQQQLTTTDMVFGLLSIVDQFGTILFERGKEFRQSSRGKELERSLSGVLEEFDKANRQGLDFIAASLDTVVRTINEFNDNGGRRNTTNTVRGKNGRSGSKGGPKKN